MEDIAIVLILIGAAIMIAAIVALARLSNRNGWDD